VSGANPRGAGDATGDVLVRGGTVLTPASPLEGDLYAEDGVIVAIGRGPTSAATVIDAAGRLVIPGFVQAHVHLCQTLLRGLGDDMDVVEWLRDRVWPLEQAHDAASLRASADVGIAELLLGGTTTVLSMETMQDATPAFEAAEALGIRAVIGPALMDQLEPGTGILGQTTDEALASVRQLIPRWQGDRVRVAVSPRGVRNATDELWRACVELAKAEGLVLHTHVAENATQNARLASAFGARDVAALAGWGALGPNLVMAHCVWLQSAEQAAVRRAGAHVCHCPSANLKLASGLAAVPEYLELGINVALGADGAACNNTLSAFTEMRLAALIHKPRCGPAAMPARTVLEMATLGGARALGLGERVGTLEPGKRADLVVLRTDRLHTRPSRGSTLESQIVYAHDASDVADVVVDGRLVVRDGRLVSGSEAAIRDEAERQRKLLLERAQISISP
jgi:5-methylthioadenosine/S-adenosylhomocysteine deaminase